jgi:nitrate/nitrite transport system ATP-binding protein
MSMSPTPVLELSDVSVSYGDDHILKNVSLKVAEGEFVAILGFSGTGKTTLINLLAGLAKPDTGAAIFRGKEIDGPGQERGLVFQSYSLMPWLTVAGNIALAVDAVHK